MSSGRKQSDVVVITEFVVSITTLGAVKAFGKHRLSMYRLEQYWKEHGEHQSKS